MVQLLYQFFQPSLNITASLLLPQDETWRKLNKFVCTISDGLQAIRAKYKADDEKPDSMNDRTLLFVEMKLDCCVFLWKLSFLKTLEITTPLKSGPHRAHSP
jgi:hypothetical protein